MTADLAPASASSTSARSTRPAMTLLAAGALAAESVLFALFMTGVRAEPRWDLASGALLLLAAAALAVAGVRWAPALALPVGLAVLDRVQVYVPFSLERPDELTGQRSAPPASWSWGSARSPVRWRAGRPTAGR